MLDDSVLSDVITFWAKKGHVTMHVYVSSVVWNMCFKLLLSLDSSLEESRSFWIKVTHHYAAKSK